MVEGLVPQDMVEYLLHRRPGQIAQQRAIRAEVSEGVDALLDTALLAEQSFGAIGNGGCYIPVRGWDDRPAERGIQIRPVLVYEALERTHWLELIRRLAEAGTLKPRIAGEYAPEDLADAQSRLMAGGLRGRSVIIFQN